MRRPARDAKRPIDWEGVAVLAIALVAGFVPVVHALVAHLPFDLEPTLGLLLIACSALLAVRELMSAKRASTDHHDEGESE